jgi:hypothetical protein
LGLAIVGQIAQMMGGTVGCESTYGVGSTFWFTVKLTKVNPAANGDKQTLSALTVLVIEPHQTTSGLILHVFMNC